MASLNKKESKVEYIISLDESESWQLYKHLQHIGKTNVLSLELHNIFLALEQQFKYKENIDSKSPDLIGQLDMSLGEALHRMKREQFYNYIHEKYGEKWLFSDGGLSEEELEVWLKWFESAGPKLI